MEMTRTPFRTVCALALLAIGSSALAQKTYSPEELKRLVDAKKYPATAAPTTNIELLAYPACLAKIDARLKSGGAALVSRSVVSTNVMRVERIWLKDSAMTLTCLGADKKFITTTAPYL